MPDVSYREWIEKARAGDRDALGLLVEKHLPRLEALVHVRLGARLRQLVTIDDVCQETWMRATESIATFRCHNKKSFFLWLGGIAEHVIKSLARRHLQAEKRDASREVLLSALDSEPRGAVLRADGMPVAEGTSPSQALRRQERFERLEKALNSLSEEHREVIILARLHGLSRKEIGERMQRNEDAVSMLLLRALKKLHEHFGPTDSYHLPASRLRDPEEIDRERPAGQRLAGEGLAGNHHREENRAGDYPAGDHPAGNHSDVVEGVEEDDPRDRTNGRFPGAVFKNSGRHNGKPST